MKRSALGSEGTAHSFVTARTATLFWQSSPDYTRTPRLETAIAHSQSGNRKQRVAATFITTSLRRNTRLLRQQKLVIGGRTNMRVCHLLNARDTHYWRSNYSTMAEIQNTRRSQ